MKDRENTRKILILTHNKSSPSFRYRIAPMIPELKKLGHSCEIVELRSKQYLYRLFKIRKTLRDAEAVILHKLKLPTLESSYITKLNANTYFDLDDAIYLRQPKSASRERSPSRSRQRKFRHLARRVKYVIAGNQVLFDHAKKQGANAVISVTGVNVDDYHVTPIEKKQGSTVVWVGLPDNLRYLEPFREAFRNIARARADFKLRIITSREPQWSDLPIEFILWSEAGEKVAISESDIGIMPLQDDPYSRGKCAFKLLQYMAAGLPCVASPVGANKEAVLHGQTGFHARTTVEWEKAILRLLADGELRKRMGEAGRRRVVDHFNEKTIAEEMAVWMVRGK